MAKDYSKLEKDDLLKVITKLESRKKSKQLLESAKHQVEQLIEKGGK